MLVVGEKRVVTISEIGERAAQVETVFNGRSVVHGSEVVLLDGQDHQLLKDLVSHHELFASARDVSVVVQNSHASVTSNLYLYSDIASEIGMNLCFLSRVNSWVKGSNSVVKSLVPYLINHIVI